MSNHSKRRTIAQRRELVKYVKYKAPRDVRLKAIKELFAKELVICDTCGRNFKDEMYLSVDRWSSGKTVKTFNVCKRCASSKDSVLAIVDGDKIRYGIAYVDDFMDYQKEYLIENRNLIDNLLLGFLYNPYIKEEDYKNGLRR